MRRMAVIGHESAPGQGHYAGSPVRLRCITQPVAQTARGSTRSPYLEPTTQAAPRSCGIGTLVGFVRRTVLVLVPRTARGFGQSQVHQAETTATTEHASGQAHAQPRTPAMAAPDRACGGDTVQVMRPPRRKMHTKHPRRLQRRRPNPGLLLRTLGEPRVRHLL